MANPAIVQTDEEEALVDNMRQPPKALSSRRYGLATLIFASVALVGAALLGRLAPEKHLTNLQYASLMTKTFMTAFSARHLAQSRGKFGAEMSFLWAEEGAADPGNMTIEIALQMAKSEHKLPEIQVVFMAKRRNETKRLTSHLEKIKAEFHSVLAAENEKQAAIFNRSVTISVSDVDARCVLVKIIGPPGGFGDSQAILERVEAPTLLAKVALGRTIPEMLNHIDDNIMALPGGIKASFHTSLGLKLLAGLESIVRLGDLDEVSSSSSRLFKGKEKHELHQVVRKLRAISSIGMDMVIRYRREELSKLDALPAPFSIGVLPELLQDVEDAIKEAVYALTTSSVDLLKLEFRGLPDNWDLSFKFSNFSASSLLAALFPEGYGLRRDIPEEVAWEEVEEPSSGEYQCHEDIAIYPDWDDSRTTRSVQVSPGDFVHVLRQKKWHGSVHKYGRGDYVYGFIDRPAAGWILMGDSAGRLHLCDRVSEGPMHGDYSEGDGDYVDYGMDG